MVLRLRNTLSRRVEPVVPIAGDTVRMYSCGPTVYRFAHVGNLRTFLLPDFIRRVLLFHGVDVLHVQNITDVGHLRDERADRGEDRMLVAAGLEGRSTAEIAAGYETTFHADEAAVNILPAHAFPRATDHIADMVALIERLEDAGFAYRSDLGNVYFRVAKVADYGRLSGNNLDELRAGHRGEVDPDKADPADFALWKAAGPGRVLRWPTPRWGEGFPGWHIECSAMALRYLGEEFEIHTGGTDNVFPHHEDEIAQMSALTGTAPARLWVHGEHLLQSGRKMAKSAGNFLRITEVADAGVEPLAFRYLALTVHYSRKLNLSDESISAAGRALASLQARLAALGPPPAEGPWAPLAPIIAGTAGDRPEGVARGMLGHQARATGSPARSPTGADTSAVDLAHAPGAPLSTGGRRLHDRFVAALDNDLDLPRALAVVREVVRTGLPADERRWLVLAADRVLGLDLHRTWGGVRASKSGADPAGSFDTPLPEAIAALVAERGAARARRDYQRADALRDEIADLAWDVVDGPDGPTVTRRAASPTVAPSLAPVPGTGGDRGGPRTGR